MIITNFEKFNEGLFTPKVVYRKSGSKHDEEIGTFVKIREDGKYSILFDNGIKFAADPRYVFTYDEKEVAKNKIKKLDPYDEEIWDKDEIENIVNKEKVRPDIIGPFQRAYAPGFKREDDRHFINEPKYKMTKSEQERFDDHEVG